MVNFALLALAGFVGRLVDAALGKGYGVVASAVLLSVGVPPVTASAGVHAIKLFIGGLSALGHSCFGDIDGSLLARLGLGGAIGGAAGGAALVYLEPASARLCMIGWLALMGVMMLWQTIRGASLIDAPFSRNVPLGLLGGFFTALGGGGWGATVSATLIARGVSLRQAVGTSNTAEFMVAIAVSATFAASLLAGQWPGVGALDDYLACASGLIVGEILAAPFALLLLPHLSLVRRTR